MAKASPVSVSKVGKDICLSVTEDQSEFFTSIVTASATLSKVAAKNLGQKLIAASR